MRPYLLNFFFEFFENSMYYILIILPLRQRLPEPPACFHSHWTWCPYFLFVCFPPLSPIYVAYIVFHMWASIGTRVVSLPGDTSLKKMDSTFPSNRQLLIAPQAPMSTGIMVDKMADTGWRIRPWAYTSWIAWMTNCLLRKTDNNPEVTIWAFWHAPLMFFWVEYGKSHLYVPWQ